MKKIILPGITISAMLIVMAMLPFHVAMLICILVFILLLSVSLVLYAPLICEENPKDNKDIYPEEFTSIDDVPVVKIDEHC